MRSALSWTWRRLTKAPRPAQTRAVTPWGYQPVPPPRPSAARPSVPGTSVRRRSWMDEFGFIHCGSCYGLLNPPKKVERVKPCTCVHGVLYAVIASRPDGTPTKVRRIATVGAPIPTIPTALADFTITERTTA